MKDCIFIVISLFWGFTLYAQPVLSLQAEPAEAFVMGIVGKKVQAPQGRLTFRLAKPGKYPMTIGFIRPGAKPLSFIFDYAGKEESLIVLRQQNGAWKLTKGRSSKPASLPSIVPAKGMAVSEAETPSSDFAEMLTMVSGTTVNILSADPATAPSAVSPAPVRLEGVPASNSNTAYNPQLNLEDTLTSPAEDTVAAFEGPSGVIKYSTQESDSGTAAVFLDFKGEQTDTLRVYVPGTKEVAMASEPEVAKPGTIPPATIPAPVPPAVSSAPLPASAGAPGNPYYQPPVPSAATDVAPAETKAPVSASYSGNVENTNAKCTQLATDAEVQKLRKRMVNDGTDIGMLQMVGKALKQKCFSTDQLRSLGLMFLNDEARFNFFSAGFPSVYDPQNWPALTSQLIDPQWRTRLLNIPATQN